MADELRPESMLYADELVIWDRMTPLLAMLNRLRPWYIDSLVEYCRVVVTLAKLAKFLRENGETYEVESRYGSQIKNRPEVGQFNENRRMLRTYVGDFGLSPATEHQFDAVQMDLINDNPFLNIQRRVNE